MKILIAAVLTAAATLMFCASAAAADDIQTGWAAWFSSAKLDDRHSLISDVQVRSSDDWRHLRTVIARVGATRVWRPGITLGAGAAYVETVNADAPNLSEHRIWQQVAFQSTYGPRALTQRVRLEQRWLERSPGVDAYSTRLRYFARFTVPIGGADGPTSGSYLALQNELMLNMTGKRNLNGKMFDQNRAYLGIGRRLSLGLDLEIGYLNQFLAGRTRDTSNHAIQAAVHTRW